MKKIIIVGISVLCVVSFVLFMAQRCGPEHFLNGTWECVNDYFHPMKNVMIIESGSFESLVYDSGDPDWVLVFGSKGTFTIDDSTMTLTYTHLKSPPYYPDYIDSSHPAWEDLVAHLPGGQTTQSLIFGMTRDINHMFIHSYLWMQYSGDAWHFEKQ